MHTDSEYFGRTALLAGDGMMETMASLRVIVFGVGGVGSWCVEALARSGTGHITLVDPDCVAPSNINRQMPALSSTIGRPKVDVVAERIRDINPEACVTALQMRYTPENAAGFGLGEYDFVIDAIDSLSDKADLILRCTDPESAPRRGFFSSMGAARKLDPSKIGRNLPQAQIQVRLQPRVPAAPCGRSGRSKRHIHAHHSHIRTYSRLADNQGYILTVTAVPHTSCPE